MHRVLSSALSSAAIMAVSIPNAVASAPLGPALGGSLPVGSGGILGLAAAGVVAGVWLVRRKR